MKKKYLVTGGAGFIGSNIAEELVRRGHFVRVLDDLSAGSKDNLAGFIDKIDFIKGDIRDGNDVKKALKDIDFVIHHAAYRNVAGSVENPLLARDVNANGTFNLLFCAKNAKIKRFVYASTSSVYGDSTKYPQNEELELKPISPYGSSKLVGERFCRKARSEFGLETVIFRYFNVFGPRQNPESRYSSVIPAFISSLIENKPCVIDGDGKQSRDFVFVSDIVRANIAACEVKEADGHVFNVGMGKDHSILDTAEILKKLLKKDLKHVYAPKRPGDVLRTCADSGKMRSLLGLENLVKFEEGLQITVDWFLKKHG